MRTQVINLRQKNLRHHLQLRTTLICRLLKGAGYAREVLCTDLVLVLPSGLMLLDWILG